MSQKKVSFEWKNFSLQIGSDKRIVVLRSHSLRLTLQFVLGFREL